MLQVNDRVAYSAQFCRSIGTFAGDIPHARGHIIALSTVGNIPLAEVRWEDGTTMKVHTNNLAKVGPIPKFCAC